MSLHGVELARSHQVKDVGEEQGVRFQRYQGLGVCFYAIKDVDSNADVSSQRTVV